MWLQTKVWKEVFDGLKWHEGYLRTYIYFLNYSNCFNCICLYTASSLWEIPHDCGLLLLIIVNLVVLHKSILYVTYIYMYKKQCQENVYYGEIIIKYISKGIIVFLFKMISSDFIIVTLKIVNFTIIIKICKKCICLILSVSFIAGYGTTYVRCSTFKIKNLKINKI